MIDYNMQLEELFARWIERSEQNNEPREEGYGRIIFTKDGLMEKNDVGINISEAWQKAQRRILFLVKDQPSEWCDDSRLWLRDIAGETDQNRHNKENNRVLKSRFLHNIADMFWGLWNATPNNLCTSEQLRTSFEQVKECFNRHPFAYVECKKQGGSTSISDLTLLQYLNKYGDLLREEIELLAPNIIVCTNPHIYNSVQNMYGNEFEQIKDHNSIRIDLRNKKIILCSFHPSAWNVNVYEGVMDHFRAYLLSDHPKFL